MALPSYKAQTDNVNKVYDKALENDVSALKASYDQNMIDAEAAKNKIPETYQQQANASAATYEVQKRAFDEAANANGINTGAGSQVKLAMLNQQARNQNDISTAMANASNDIENNILKLKANYQNAIQQATGANEYERAAALLKEYQSEAQSALNAAQKEEERKYAEQMNRAETLAGFGDFSGFSAMGYTPEQIARMQSAWEYQNPRLAEALNPRPAAQGNANWTKEQLAAYQDYINDINNAPDYVQRYKDSGYSAEEAVQRANATARGATERNALMNAINTVYGA